MNRVLNRRTSRPQRGSAMLVTLLVIVSLVAGAAVLVGLQMASNRSTDLTRSGTNALYCAEAGLVAARPIVVANFSQWSTALALSAANDFSEPPWLAAGIDGSMGGHDLDTTVASTDFRVHLEDNHDEPGASIPGADTDLRIFIVSTCLAYPDTPKQVRELVEYNGVVACYPWQIGGCGGANNTN